MTAPASGQRNGNPTTRPDEGRPCLCVRRCSEVSEPSRQKKWVTLTPGHGGGGGRVRLPFPVVFHCGGGPDLVSELWFSSIS